MQQLFKQIKVSDITVGSYTQRGDLSLLKESIETLGLIHLPTVDEENHLVSGFHRLEVYKSLFGEDATIQVHVLKVPDAMQAHQQAYCNLVRIDENLARNNLFELEYCQQLNERKKIFENMNPERKRGGAPGLSGGGKAGMIGESFAETVAKVTGLSKRAVQLKTQIAENITRDVAAKILTTNIKDDQKKLLLIARQKTKEDQLKVLEELQQQNYISTKSIKIANLKTTCKIQTIYKTASSLSSLLLRLQQASEPQTALEIIKTIIAEAQRAVPLLTEVRKV